MAKSKFTILSCLYPSWLDVIVLVLLVMTRNNFTQDGLAIAILVLGCIRYLIQVIVIGFMSFNYINWYIKQTIYLMVALLCFLTYEPKTFTWIFSIYFFEMSFIEIVVSLLKRGGK